MTIRRIQGVADVAAVLFALTLVGCIVMDAWLSGVLS